MKKIGVLTSSRADYGIYRPLLKELRAQNSLFALHLIAFGTHLSKDFGLTRNEIIADGFDITHELQTHTAGTKPKNIGDSFALTTQKFNNFWSNHQFDLVFCLGDRYEMAAAVFAGIPYSVKFAHIHGGETTLGATDNIYRHAISLASCIHFVATETFAERVRELVHNKTEIVIAGALGLDNLEDVKLLSNKAFYKKWNIDLNKKSLLVTLHPETVNFEKNQNFANIFVKALSHLAMDYQLIVSLPNADIGGDIFRKKFHELKNNFPDKVFLIEHFGTASYYTAMKAANLVLGNSSSGIIEAASFSKYVINIGDRQKGRLHGENVIHSTFNAEEIIQLVKQYSGHIFDGNNIYKKDKAAKIIFEKIRSYFQIAIDQD